MRNFIVVLLFVAGALGQSSPELSLKDATGKTYNLSDYRGKVVVLNFWATWCVPCKEEMPIFTEAYKRYNRRGLVVLAASLDDARTKKYVAKFVQNFKMEFPVLLDATPATMQQIGLGDSVPSTVFIDEGGNLAGKIVGQADKKDVLARIEKLLAHPGEQTAAQRAGAGR
jgi:cytochrome c biogenesis protein CcmG, thiol:disulfide interchange protein DsbE